MPARSTPFQKLVVHLQSLLSSGCEVTESAFLTHRPTGSPREVDVVIRSTVGEHEVVVAIEVIEHQRPADVTWVEKMLKKHEHLETHKLVLVSLSGFSADAIALAKSEGSEAYTPDEAYAADWTRIVGTPHVTLARFDVVVMRLEVGLNSVERAELPGNCALFDRGAGYISTLNEMVTNTLLSDPRYYTQVEPFLVDRTEAELDLRMELTGERFISTGGSSARVTDVFARLKASRRSTPIPLRSLTWRTTPVAFGSALTAFGDTTLTVVESEPGKVDVQVTVDGQPMPMLRR